MNYKHIRLPIGLVIQSPETVITTADKWSKYSNSNVMINVEKWIVDNGSVLSEDIFLKKYALLQSVKFSCEFCIYIDICTEVGWDENLKPDD